MATAREIVTRALRRINVISRTRAATAADMAAGLDSLNSMLFSWQARGVDTSPVEMSLGDTLLLNERYHRSVVNLLAAEIAPEYERPAPDARRDWHAIQAAYLVVPIVSFERALTRLPSWHGGEPEGDETLTSTAQAAALAEIEAGLEDIEAVIDDLNED